MICKLLINLNILLQQNLYNLKTNTYGFLNLTNYSCEYFHVKQCRSKIKNIIFFENSMLNEKTFSNVL